MDELVWGAALKRSEYDQTKMIMQHIRNRFSVALREICRLELNMFECNEILLDADNINLLNFKLSSATDAYLQELENINLYKSSISDVTIVDSDALYEIFFKKHITKFSIIKILENAAENYLSPNETTRKYALQIAFESEIRDKLNSKILYLNDEEYNNYKSFDDSYISSVLYPRGEGGDDEDDGSSGSGNNTPEEIWHEGDGDDKTIMYVFIAIIAMMFVIIIFMVMSNRGRVYGSYDANYVADDANYGGDDANYGGDV